MNLINMINTTSKIIFFTFIFLIASCTNPKPKEQEKHSEKSEEIAPMMEGDIVFQTSNSNQSKAIQLATSSPYSHCGILFLKDKHWMVYEGVQPIKFTPLNQWIKQGKRGEYIIKRHKNASTLLSPKVLNKMRKEGVKFLGKNYDLTFGWSDERIYCSELVWKIYYRGTGLRIGKLQLLKEFKLDDPLVRGILIKRYKTEKAIPLNDTVISPGAIFLDTNFIEIPKL